MVLPAVRCLRRGSRRDLVDELVFRPGVAWSMNCFGCAATFPKGIGLRAPWVPRDAPSFGSATHRDDTTAPGTRRRPSRWTKPRSRSIDAEGILGGGASPAGARVTDSWGRNARDEVGQSRCVAARDAVAMDRKAPTTVPRSVRAEVGFRCPVAGCGSPYPTGTTSTRRGASDTTTSSQARSRFDLTSTRTVAGGRNRTGA
jgi:hypothetical protein